MQNSDQNVAAQEVAALLSIHAQREPSSRFQNIIVQAPEDSKDVVAAAKRVLNQSDVNALGLRDQRDMTRLIAQSALQVYFDLTFYSLFSPLLFVLTFCFCHPFVNKNLNSFLRESHY